ncbi:MAG: Spo0B domain-containing protein [Firmicutes bacterium]|nr:Spo0B domain-containing protein [Bacillota bacterium]
MKQNSLTKIQSTVFRTQLILLVTLALFLGVAGTQINLHFETETRDRNLRNVAEAIARSPILAGEIHGGNNASAMQMEYLDSLRDTLEDIDVISVVSKERVRIYHSNHDLIGTEYDGTIPVFETTGGGYYAVDETGPSGVQRRAYAAVYDETGRYQGFVMAIMLRKSIYEETVQTYFIYALITVAAVLMELLLSAELSGKIRNSLLGYEPDVFTAMYKIRNHILESLDEGIRAKDRNGEVQFTNTAAEKMLASEEADLMIDRVPIREDGEIIGSVEILRDRAEYTKLMEDLAGTRHLVDSMRANNHDFTNKLHVILGLIQMEMYNEASEYIQNITMVQRSVISNIMNTVQEPSLAALLIGKTARASELNIRFVLREGCCYSAQDMELPKETLVTIIGNLLDNAFEAMNERKGYDIQNELMFGIYSRPGAVLITVDDTGNGITPSVMEHIFEQGFSTKGDGRGTGLYQVKTLTEGLGGQVTVESQEGVGTSVSVSFMKHEKGGSHHV